jgi:hypothetical protein
MRTKKEKTVVEKKEGKEKYRALLHHILFAQLISTSQNTRLRGA